jgi:hypothetical protein
LTETAREWEQHGRDRDLLFTGARLATAREWSESHSGELSPAEVEFLSAGTSAEQSVDVRSAKDRSHPSFLSAFGQNARVLFTREGLELGQQLRL